MRKLATLAAASTLLFGTAFTAPDAEECTVTDDGGTPEDASDDTGYCTVATYLQCTDAIGGKVQLLPPVATPVIALGEERPETSFTAGGGCGTYENAPVTGATQDNIHDLVFGGRVKANIDSLAVELHDIYAGPERNSGKITLGVRVSIGGKSPFGTETVELATGPIEVPRMVPIEAVASPSSTGASETFHFTITGLGDALGTIKPGTLTGANREIKISIDGPTGAHIFVWGASEIPAGVLLNPAEPLGTVVPAATE